MNLQALRLVIEQVRVFRLSTLEAEWVDQITYSGVFYEIRDFAVDVSSIKRKFYASALKLLIVLCCATKPVKFQPIQVVLPTAVHMWFGCL
jgi:hypothetical protein